MPYDKNAAKFYCENCDFKCSKQSNFNTHLSTRKHQANIHAAQEKVDDKIRAYKCDCGKIYKHSQSLNVHKKICRPETGSGLAAGGLGVATGTGHGVSGGLPIKNSNTFSANSSSSDSVLAENLGSDLGTEKELILFLLKENHEFKQLLIEQSNKMLELAAKPSSITNNNCNNKQQFNLQVFLNEKCKNAMNITDFVNSLDIVSEDLEDFGKFGYVQGISNIFIKGLKDLDETERPLHCTDKKRETLYIKDVKGWDKDEKREKIKKVIREIAHRNFKHIPKWKAENPSALDVTTKKNNEYMSIVKQVMTSISPDDELGINKIIKNVANQVCVDRSILHP